MPNPGGQIIQSQDCTQCSLYLEQEVIKPDYTSPDAPQPKPDNKPRAARPIKTIKKPDRLIESK